MSQDQLVTVTIKAGAASYASELENGTASDADFTIVAGADGNVSVGSPATITIAANTVSTASSLPETLTDFLTVTPGAGAMNAGMGIPVTLNANVSGAILAFSPSSVIAFGTVAVGDQLTLPFTLINTGNADAQVTVSPSNAPAFTPASQTLTVPGDGGTAQGSVTFAPTTAGPVAPAAQLSVTNVTGTGLCQPAPTVGLTGSGAEIALSTNELDFGNVPCGVDAGARAFTLTGSTQSTFTAQLENGSAFTLGCTANAVPCQGAGSGFTGTLGVNPVTLTVTPLPIPQTSPVTPGYYADAVDIETNGAGQGQVLIFETASGAILTWAPASVGFGNVPVGTTAPSQPFQLVNAGNANAGVTLSLSSPAAGFALDFDGGPLPAGADVTAAAGGATSFGATFAPAGTTPQSSNVTLSVEASTVLCAPLPGSDGGPGALTLSGQGTTGPVAYSPSAIDFGLLPCGTLQSKKGAVVTLTNEGSVPFTYTCDAGLYQQLLGCPGSAVAADGGTATIEVASLAVPQTSAIPGPYDDWLTIDTDAKASDGGTISIVIPITLSAQGVILAGFVPDGGQVSFLDAPIGGESSYPLYIQNLGNMDAPLTFDSTEPQFSSDPVTVPANGNATWNVTFTPQVVGPYNGSATIGVELDGGAVLCQPLPAVLSSLALTGTGQNPAPFYATTSLVDFGEVSCGGAAAAPQTVTLVNNETAAKSWNASLSPPVSGGPDGGGPLFTLSADAGTIPADGGTAAITITPAALTTTLGMTGPITTQLVVSSGTGFGEEFIKVNIVETAEGAMLAWNPGNLSFTSCAGTPATDLLVDTGNQGAAVTLTPSGDTNHELSFSANPLQVTAGDSATETVTCTGVATPDGGETVSVAASVPSGTPLCAPLPGPFTITTP